MMRRAVRLFRIVLRSGRLKTVRAAVAEFGEKRKLHAEYYSFECCRLG